MLTCFPNATFSIVTVAEAVESSSPRTFPLKLPPMIVLSAANAVLAATSPSPSRKYAVSEEPGTDCPVDPVRVARQFAVSVVSVLTPAQ